MPRPGLGIGLLGPGFAALVAAALPAAAVSAGPVSAPVAVRPGELAAAIREAPEGAVIELAPGVYSGHLQIKKPLEIRGRGGADPSIVDGGGQGRVITVSAPGVVLRGLTIRNSGKSLAKEDSGIFLTKAATGAVVENNVLLGNLIGIDVKGAADARIAGNHIEGLRDPHMNERGNGVQVWNAPGTVVADNFIRYGRDGIFTTTSRRNRFSGNSFHDLRYGVHYMYTQDSEVTGNSSYHNHAGYALMYSSNIVARDNLSDGDRDHGILLNYVNHSSIEDNAVVGGGGKCVFIYNSNVNAFRRNWFEGCDIGVHFTAGSERNEIVDNAFVGNRTQVKYVGTRHLDWTVDGRGNYWSDNPAFDLDGDGVADRPYRPNDMVDQVVWAHPVAKLLLNGPAVTLLRYAQQRLPSLHPGGVMDSAPLMRPPLVAARERANVAEAQ